MTSLGGNRNFEEIGGAAIVNAPDKFIVDRRKPRRNTDVARTIRRTREQLSQTAGNPVFDRELLKIHAGRLRRTFVFLPILVLCIAGGGLSFGFNREIAAWAAMALLSYGLLCLYARRIEDKDLAEVDPIRTRNMFLGLHFITGLSWAYFATLDCTQCGDEPVHVIRSVLLLIAIACTAVTASSLQWSLIASFGVPVVVAILFDIGPRTMTDAVISALLLGSLPFFSYIMRELNQSSTMLLTFRSENDGLVAEVETAKALSEEARRRAEDSNLAKSRFLATMSHELRTPLNAILGFSEVMAKEVLGPIENTTYKEYAQDINDSGRHLLDLINEILDLSRIEAGKYQLNEEPLQLASLVDDCCYMVELRARNKNIQIDTQFEPNLPRLYADERAVRQITLNLLSNAIKFSPNGGHVLVRVGWTAGAGQYVSVKDNGPGIPPDEIPVVLSAFGQGSIAIKAAEQGTGLGLPIVQGLLELHGGEFVLESELRNGTEAIAVFPPSRVMEALPAVATPQTRTQRMRGAA